MVSEGKTSVRDKTFSVFAGIKDLGLLRKMGGGKGKKTRRSKLEADNCICQLSHSLPQDRL